MMKVLAFCLFHFLPALSWTPTKSPSHRRRHLTKLWWIELSEWLPGQLTNGRADLSLYICGPGQSVSDSCRTWLLNDKKPPSSHVAQNRIVTVVDPGTALAASLYWITAFKTRCYKLYATPGSPCPSAALFVWCHHIVGCCEQSQTYCTSGCHSAVTVQNRTALLTQTMIRDRFFLLWQ